MGILSDFANSSLGDLTIGAFEGLNEAAQKDVVVNATASNASLDRENKAYDLVELVYKNKDELKKKLLLNPSEFGLFAQDGQSLDSVADRFTNFMMLNNRSIFEHKNFNNVMLDAAKFMAAGIDQGGFTIYDPYISGEDRFNQEKELHQARISEITKMPKADKLLMKVKEAEAEVATPESITDELLKVQSLTAKGFGILNTFPTTIVGRKNLEASQVSIIVSNAMRSFPDDSQARQTFINQKLYENDINPLDGIRYKSDVTYLQMAKIMETEGISLANQITNLTNMMASADGEKQEQINNQKNILLLEQHKLMDKYSAQAVAALAGDDRSTIFPEETTGDLPLPLAAEGYIPTINSEGNLVIDLANGNRQTLPLEILIDSPESVKLLPIEAQNYVNQIKSKLFVDGEMIKPTREMFEDGAAGDKAFRDFLGIYNFLNIEERDMSVEGTGVSDMDPLSEKEKIKKDFEKEKESFKDADITKFKEAPKGDDIKIEELPPANTEAPKKKPDQPEEPKEKSLQEKIDEDFGNANVGTSGGNVNVKEGTKKKTNTQTQTEDVFEGSGVEPMYQSASLASNDKFIKRIMDDEGEPFLEATKAFEDEKNFTIGYGRNNPNIKKGDKITLEQAQKNLAEDVEIRLEEIQDLIPNFSRFSNELQLALFSEYYRGSVRQSPKTVKLINEGKFAEAAAEFLDNDEYRNAVDRGRRGIRKRMKRVFNLLRRESAQSMLSNTVSA